MMTLDYIEYGVVKHCNLRCLGCTVFAPYMSPCFADVESYRRDVTELAKHIHVKRFRLLGGEPLLHKNIIDFLQIAKESGISDHNSNSSRLNGIGVCTNGALLMKMPDEFFKTIEFLDISVYPGANIDYIEIGKFITEKRKECNNSFALKIKYHKSNFMVVNKDEKELNDKQTYSVYKNCSIIWNWKCHQFDDGIFFKCAKPAYQNAYFKRRGTKCDTDFRKEDGLLIHEPGFGEKLKPYLRSKQPLKACAYCNGTSGPKYSNRQMTREELGL